MEFFKFLFGFSIDTDYGETSNVWLYISIAVIILVFALLAFICLSNRKNLYNVYAIAFAAICIGTSFGLSYIAPIQLPQGGSVTIASLLPICLYAYVFGFKRGLLAGLIYGVLQIIQKPYIYNLTQTLLDYTLAFATVSLSGLFPIIVKKFESSNRVTAFISRFDFTFSLLFVGIVRYAFHVLSGIIFFGSWAMEGYGAVSWAFLYNTFVLADIALCIIPAVLLQISPAFMRYIKQVRYKVTMMDKLSQSQEVQP